MLGGSAPLSDFIPLSSPLHLFVSPSSSSSRPLHSQVQHHKGKPSKRYERKNGDEKKQQDGTLLSLPFAVIPLRPLQAPHNVKTKCVENEVQGDESRGRGRVRFFPPKNNGGMISVYPLITSPLFPRSLPSSLLSPGFHKNPLFLICWEKMFSFPPSASLFGQLVISLSFLPSSHSPEKGLISSLSALFGWRFSPFYPHSNLLLLFGSTSGIKVYSFKCYSSQVIVMFFVTTMNGLSLT